MAMPRIQTTKKVIPLIYAYTTPEIARHDGWTKIGYTEKDADERIKEQVGTADVKYVLEWKGNAVYEGTDETFTDHDFHAYLTKGGVERGTQKDGNGKVTKTEWFHILPDPAHHKFYDFRSNKGVLKSSGAAVPYVLRDEQTAAVTQTLDYFHSHEASSAEFLWNAKPRFGKTLTTYDLVKQLHAMKVLIVTNRPAIANSWYEDYEKFLGTESGYCFVSNVDALKNRPHVISREKYMDINLEAEEEKGCIEFVSLQDLKGSVHFGGTYDKLGEVAKLSWDLLVIDEAHEGVDTYKTDVAFDQIQRRFTLHLSGTPFKALANDKFSSDAIYNWTYADEQKAKAEWNDPDRENPYVNLPRLNLLTYRMSDIVFEKLKTGADFDEDGDAEAYAFDLNEFFKTNKKGEFVHDADVDKFLDALTTQKKFPFAAEYRDELKHTLWMLKYVSSAKALAKKLQAHPVFQNYEIVLAAGDGKLNDDGTANSEDASEKATGKAYDKVVKAISEHDKTITLSVGQLTTGITIPEWTAVIMLSNMSSPALYMQAAFRAQNPCLFHDNHGGLYRKQDAYVFDFDPARTLEIVEKFATGLHEDTANGKGDTDLRQSHIRELLNFFPVYAEDDGGEMMELDAAEILSIPRAIHAKEVVRSGFMNNYLFQNISGIFAAPSVVVEILNKFEPVKEPSKVTEETKNDLDINEDGEVEVPQEKVIGLAKGLLGDKMYADNPEIQQGAEEALTKAQKKLENAEPNEESKAIQKLKTDLTATVSKPIEQKAKEQDYGKQLSFSAKSAVQKKIAQAASAAVDKHHSAYTIQKNEIEAQRKRDVETARQEQKPTVEIEAINRKAEEDTREAEQAFLESVQAEIPKLTEEAAQVFVQGVETDKKQKEKKTIEDNVRDHLRGFSRTIPSFLMAYGDANTTLETFDKIIPADVFKEVTGITLDQFLFLRDGGPYTDKETGEGKHYEGHLFDPIVFNDSVKEFLRLRHELADYFAPEAEHDIFDYIPPQKTNQIYTPRRVVKEMVDLLEQENPGCFDNPDYTFLDPYMKSGLYITEIVKRLYQSQKMRELYPNDKERLQHIFSKQVYGLAPTKIIYAISTHYILGFSDEIPVPDEHFKFFDALPAAKNGTLKEELGRLFAN